MADTPRRSATFFSGVALGALLSLGVTLGATWAVAARAGLLTPAHVEPAPELLPSPVSIGELSPRPPRDPQRQPTASQRGPTDETCALALKSEDVDDLTLFACATSNRLGKCHVWKGKPGSACDAYAGSEKLCDQGLCGPPLNGTGCVSQAYYGLNNPSFLCTGNEVAVAACMMRRLMRAGHCE